MDLPDEILLEIFERVDGWTTDYPPPYFDLTCHNHINIQKTRLVCRRFNEIGSQLLVRVVRVRPDEKSLGRLDQISRHPTIAKGVQEVRVGLHFYNSFLLDFGNLLEHQISEISQEVHYEELNSSAMSPTELERTAQAKEVRDALQRIMETDPDWSEDELYRHSLLSKADIAYRRRLLGVHARYQTLFQQQEALLETGRFCGSLASAIARMPRARKLAFTDTDVNFIPMPRVMNGERDIWCAVEAYMLKPPSGVDARLAQLEVPSYACILETIQAMGDAGACVTSIEARLTSNGAPGGLFVSPERKQRISSVTRQLREFTFNTREVAPRESADIESFLSALSDTASLQKFGFGLVDDGFFVNVGRVIASRARPRLRNVYVATASLHLSTLAAALEQLPESMDCIGLRNIRLLSGSWEHALDLLAQKAPRVCLLRNPSGAECEELSEQELDDIFGREDRNNSTDAETYIRRDPSSKKYNPFRYRRDLAEIARQIQAEAAAQLAEEEE